MSIELLSALLTAFNLAWSGWLKLQSDRAKVDLEYVSKQLIELKAENQQLKAQMLELQEKDRTKDRIIANMQTEIAVLKAENTALREYNQKLESKLSGRQLL